MRRKTFLSIAAFVFATGMVADTAHANGLDGEDYQVFVVGGTGVGGTGHKRTVTRGKDVTVMLTAEVDCKKWPEQASVRYVNGDGGEGTEFKSWRALACDDSDRPLLPGLSTVGVRISAQETGTYTVAIGSHKDSYHIEVGDGPVTREEFTADQARQDDRIDKVEGRLDGIAPLGQSVEAVLGVATSPKNDYFARTGVGTHAAILWSPIDYLTIGGGMLWQDMKLNKTGGADEDVPAELFVYDLYILGSLPLYLVDGGDSSVSVSSDIDKGESKRLFLKLHAGGTVGYMDLRVPESSIRQGNPPSGDNLGEPYTIHEADQEYEGSLAIGAFGALTGYFVPNFGLRAQGGIHYNVSDLPFNGLGLYTIQPINLVTVYGSLAFVLNI